MRCLLLIFIRAYQVTVSPDHGVLKAFYPYGYCQFHPTCSMFGYGSIERFGAIKGSWMAFKRIMRCHPWSDGGYDPVPEMENK